ncbi:CYTF protein, partial [Polypterus senegalus]
MITRGGTPLIKPRLVTQQATPKLYKIRKCSVTPEGPGQAVQGVCGLSSQAANVLSFTIQPGSLKPINTTDSGVQRAVKVATYEYNNRSNDEFIFRASEVDEAEIQVVKGVKYFLAVKISRTVCHKRDRPDLDNCDFQPDGRLKQSLKETDSEEVPRQTEYDSIKQTGAEQDMVELKSKLASSAKKSVSLLNGDSEFSPYDFVESDQEIKQESEELASADRIQTNAALADRLLAKHIHEANAPTARFAWEEYPDIDPWEPTWVPDFTRWHGLLLDTTD